jgi:hypothetical protein
LLIFFNSLAGLAASYNAILSAPRLQRLTHKPQLKHFSSSISSASSWLIAPYGQLIWHWPHNEHRSMFTAGEWPAFGVPRSFILRIVSPRISSTDW